MKQVKKLCDCGHIAKSNGFSTGYGTNQQGQTKCFKCCGKEDKETLLKTGLLYGYWDGVIFTNWPGTFKLKPYYTRTSRTNWGLKRTDFWIQIKGRTYHGYHIGHNTQSARLKATNHSTVKRTN